MLVTSRNLSIRSCIIEMNPLKSWFRYQTGNKNSINRQYKNSYKLRSVIQILWNKPE
jgi:hypothetical protein